MTPQEQFRFGFLYRCAEEHLSEDDIKARVKFALETNLVTTPLKWFLGMPITALLAGMGAAGVGGLSGGYLAAKARDTEVDPEEVKNKELADTYRQFVHQLSVQQPPHQTAPQIRGPRLL